MSDVSEEALLEYFCSSGGGSGRVRNADLLKTFKPFIGHSDPQLRAKYREEFKLIIDRIAVVKSENGEKYLVLKKKYRQMLQERVGRHPRADVDGQRHASPARSPATAPWDATHTQAVSRRPHAAAEALQQVQHTEPSCPIIPVPNTAQSSREEDLDKDSGSKSESEQDEESTGSVGSAAVALDPIEKEWIYSAAGARVPDLSQLLRQDPSLANKKDFTSGSCWNTYSPVTSHISRTEGQTSSLSVSVECGLNILDCESLWAMFAHQYQLNQWYWAFSSSSHLTALLFLSSCFRDPAVTDFLHHTVCKYIIGPSLLSVSLSVCLCIRRRPHSPLCLLVDVTPLPSLGSARRR
ncbi:uncharacterized protein isoform X1 [Takifugu rubripes]|uniref:uncharacterized protein isoform X1 n=1 Tax=Takifugu rubripes TaxID=31033 RepID=UPI0011451DAB|nr:uncharacterized protein LOC101070346 isoform X1 [Takifugu rubripes]